MSMKMSDVFNLPVDSELKNLYKDDVSFRLTEKAVSTAINSHDPMYEFIEKLAAMKPTDNMDVKAMAVKVLECLK